MVIVKILLMIIAYFAIAALLIFITGLTKDNKAYSIKGCLTSYFILYFLPAIIILGGEKLLFDNEKEKEGNKIQLEQEYRHKSIEVYICTGRYAKKYHSRPNCRGLNNCRGGIKKVELEKIKGHRSPCSICY